MATKKTPFVVKNGLEIASGQPVNMSSSTLSVSAVSGSPVFYPSGSLTYGASGHFEGSLTGTAYLTNATILNFKAASAGTTFQTGADGYGLSGTLHGGFSGLAHLTNGSTAYTKDPSDVSTAIATTEFVSDVITGTGQLTPALCARWDDAVDDITAISNASGNWDTTYTRVASAHNSWDIAAADVTIIAGASADWNSVYSTVSVTSANWSTTYADVTRQIDEWNSTWNTLTATSAFWELNAADITNLANASAGWDSTKTVVDNNNAKWSYVADNSANAGSANSTYTTVNANSASWTANSADGHTLTQDISGEWDSAYTDLNANSANWDTTYTRVASAHNSWDKANTTLNANSGGWDSTKSTVDAGSTNWDAAYTDSQLNKIDITNVANASGDWGSTHTTVNVNSAQWALNAGDVTNLANASADWNNTHTTLGAYSAIWGAGASKWIEGSGKIYRLPGNVGIGTDEPNYKLDIVGNTQTVGDVRIIGDLTVSGGSSIFKITDKSLTINYGATVKSGAGAGIDVEENGVTTAYVRVSDDRKGWTLKEPNSGNTLTIDISSNRVLSVSGDMNIEPGLTKVNQDLTTDADTVQFTSLGLGAAPTPSMALTVAGAISATNVIHTSSGNSDDWQSTYTTLCTTSAGWNTGTTSLVTVGTIGTGTWQGTAIADGYISSASTWNAADAEFRADITNVANTSANWDNVYSDFKVNSGGWITGTSSIVTVGTIGTGTWNGSAIADGYISSASTWNAGIADITTLANNSAHWESTYTTLCTVSAGWVTGTTSLVTVGTIGTGTWNGSAIADGYISSASTWNAKQNALTFGIADTNAVKIDEGSVAEDDYAKFTADGLEGRSPTQVKSDLSLNNVENTALTTWAGSTNITTLGTIGTGTWQGTAIVDSYIDSASIWNATVADITNVANTSALWDSVYTSYHSNSSTGSTNNIPLFTSPEKIGNSIITQADDADGGPTITVAGSAVIQGDLTVQGDFTYLNTDVRVTDQLDVTNTGTGPAIIVNQTGSNDIVQFKDDGTPVFTIVNGGDINVKAGATIDGRDISADGTTLDAAIVEFRDDITNVANTSANWDNVYSDFKINSAGWNTGTSSIVTVGTIGTGTWNGSAIADAYISSSSNWNTAYSKSGTNETNIAAVVADMTTVANNSGDWSWAHANSLSGTDNWNWAHANSVSGTDGWNWAHANSLSGTDVWNWTHANSLSGTDNWNGAYTTVVATYSSWNWAHANALSGTDNWNTAYTDSQLNRIDLTNVANTSASWDWAHANSLSGTDFWNWAHANALSGTDIWNWAHANALSGTDNWNTAYTKSGTNETAIAAVVADMTNVANASGDWNGTHTTLNANSGNWAAWINANTNDITVAQTNIAANAADITNVANTSANWDWAHANALSGTDFWNWAHANALSGTDIWNWAHANSLSGTDFWNWAHANALSGTDNWNTAYTDSQLNKADVTNVANTSGLWDSTYTTVHGFSGTWKSTYEDVILQIDEWNSTWSTLTATSADWETAYEKIITQQDEWDSTWTTLTATSARWDWAHANALSGTDLWNWAHANSLSGTDFWNWAHANALSGTDIWNWAHANALSGTDIWNTAYTDSQLNKADLTNVANTSANWNWAHANSLSGTDIWNWAHANSLSGTDFWNWAHANALSGTDIWNWAHANALSGTDLWNWAHANALSGTDNWNTAYTDSQLNKADITNVANTSASWNWAHANALSGTDIWNWAHANALSGTDNWNTAYTDSQLNKADITNVANTSASWDWAHANSLSGTDLWNWAHANALSGTDNWNTAYTDSQLNRIDLTNVANTSAGWDATKATVDLQSGEWNSTWTTLTANSARWATNEASIATLEADVTNVANTSGLWDSTYTTVHGFSGTWKSTYEDVILQIDEWNSTWSTLTATSADWETAYEKIITQQEEWDSTWTTLTATSANWNTAYTDSQLNKADITNVANASAGWDATKATVDLQSGEWDSTWNTLTANSANWNTAYTDSQLNKADITNVANTSAGWNWAHANALSGTDLWNWSHANALSGTDNWNTAYTDSQLNKADITNVANASAGWDSTNTTVFDNSASWSAGGGGSFNSSLIASTSGTWNTAYIDSQLNKIDLTNVANTSAGWDSTKTTVDSGNANWDTAYTDSQLNKIDITNVANASANWDWAHANSLSGTDLWNWSHANALSGTDNWNTAYTDSQLNKADITNVANTSAGWDSTKTTVDSGNANWNTAYTDSQLNKADITNVANTSANWNTAYTHSQASHAPAGAQANESSFKTISVLGQSDIVADTTTDTLSAMAGDNMTITTRAGTDTIVFAATDTNTTYTAGDGLLLTSTTFSAPFWTTVNTNSADWDWAHANALSGTDNWNTAYTHSQASHAPTGAQANEYSFKTITLSGQTVGTAIGADVVADSVTDTLILSAGPNIALISDPATDTITISAQAGGGSGGDSTTSAVANSAREVSQTITVTNALSTGRVVTVAENGTYQLASANSSLSASVVGVVRKASSAAFEIVHAGLLPWSSHGFTIGNTLYLSDQANSIGGLTETEPTTVGSISKPIAITQDANNIVVLPLRGIEVRTITGSSGDSSSSGGHTVQLDGSDTTQRTNLNFVTTGGTDRVKVEDSSGTDTTTVTVPNAFDMMMISEIFR